MTRLLRIFGHFGLLLGTSVYLISTYTLLHLSYFTTVRVSLLIAEWLILQVLLRLVFGLLFKLEEVIDRSRRLPS